MDVTPENVTVPEEPIVADEGKLWLIVPDKVGAAAVTWTVRVPVIGPLLAVGLVLALMLNVTVPVGAPAANDQVTFSLAAMPLVLLNVKYDVPCSEIE